MRLAAAGHRIGINYRTHGDEAEDLKKEIESAGGTGFTVQADVGDKDQVKAMIEATIEALGPIEIMVNNAGIIDDTLFMRMKDDQFERVMQVNTFGTYYCSRAVIAPMVSARWGRIINISSVVGSMGNAGQSNYAAAKAGMEGYSRALASELGSRNITVNCIAPGFIATDMSEELPEEQKTLLLAKIPAGRLGESKEVASLAAFLASDPAGYISGETIHINGGMYMA